MNRDQTKSVIESSLRQIETEFQAIQGMILTEDDLKCCIYNKLSENYPDLITPMQTEDRQINAPMLHTELSWYDKHGRLTIKPDITILDPGFLSVLHKSGAEKVKLPSKSYSFRGNAILMELKFIKNKTGIGKSTITGKLQKDVNKIKRLFARLEDQDAPYDLFCYFVVFNKTNKKCPEFEQFIQKINNEAQSKYRMIYATGNVNFDD